MFVWFEAVFFSYLPFFKVFSHSGSLYSWLPHQRWITVWSPSCVSSGCGLYEISVPVTMVVDLEEGLRTETASEWKEKCTWSQCVYDTIFCFQVHFQWLASLYSSWCMLLSYKVLFCSVKRTTIELNNFLPVNIFLCHCRSFEKKNKKQKKTWQVILQMHIAFTCEQRFCILLVWCGSNLSLCWGLCIVCSVVIFSSLRYCLWISAGLVSNPCSRLRRLEFYPHNKTFQIGSDMHEKFK